MKLRAIVIALLTFSIILSLSVSAVEIGPLPNGGYVVSTKQLIHPAGESVEFYGRPVDIALSPDGKTLYVKSRHEIVVIDTASWKIIQNASFPHDGCSMHGIAVTKDGSKVYATMAKNELWEIEVKQDRSISWGRMITIPYPDGDPKSTSVPCGIALSQDEKTAYICLSRNNTLGVVDLTSGQLVKEIPVGVAPFDIVLSSDRTRAYVSNWGGRHSKEGEKTADSSGTKVLVDDRGVPASGTVSVVDISKGIEISEIETGLLPSDLKLSKDGKTLYVANANSDTVSVIDTGKASVSRTISVRPGSSLPFGSAPNALTLGDDGNTLYVANGGNNAIAVVSLKKNIVVGFIPTAWYPGAVTTNGRYLYVANVKGYGTRWKDPKDKAWQCDNYLGTVSKAEIPSAAQLKKYTAQVHADARVPQTLRAFEKGNTGMKPVPVPMKTGEPSVFEHVVYIIKENKTYDQVFGDIGKGNSDPNLCVYGREITPNHHALAEEFVLLDNYYCNGVRSVDGHAWATQGNSVDYLEKSFGGFTRSYPYSGDDALAFCSSGMIWDNVLSHGLSFRNYGEMSKTSIPSSATWSDVYRDYLDKTNRVAFTNSIWIENLRNYSCPDYPGWNMAIPDVLRADVFLKEFSEYEKKGNLPNVVIVFLHVDHTTGGKLGYPTPRAEVADNDLALGKVVEAITKSRFWPKTCIFVEEDDPQSGFDHVDGHRSLCLVVSPYTKRGTVVSEFYNQTAVLHTMENILGIPPMNQMDAMAPLMEACFTNQPDLRPYTCIPNKIPLDEMVQKTGYNFGDGSYFAKDGEGDPFAYPDQVDDDKLNRAIWLMAKGKDVPYPAEFAGAHGKGLKALHLELSGEEKDD